VKASPFTRTITLPKRDDTTGAVVRDAEGKPVDSDTILGELTFKRPTLREELMISTRLAEMCGGQRLDTMPARAADIAVMLAELPVVVTSAPKDWSWADLEGDADFYRIVAVWNAYQDGRREIVGAKPASDTQQSASSTTAQS